MSLPITIIDGKGKGIEACVTSATNGYKTPDGLVVYADDLLHWTPTAIPLFNSTGSLEMAVNASVGGTPELIHNGTDTVQWTASALSGTWDFASTAQAQAGTKSIDATATVNGDEALLEDGTTTDMSGYVGVSGYIYVTRYSQTNDEMRLRFRSSGVNVGNSVDIGDYVDGTNQNAWLKFSIPKGDFGIDGQTVDEMVIQTISVSGQAPDYYLDTLQIEQTGGAEYFARPGTGKIFNFVKIRLQIVDALAGTLADGTMPALSYNKILGLTALAAGGITLQRVRKGEILFATSWNTLADMTYSGLAPTVNISDGTNTMLTLDLTLTTPAIMEDGEDDYVSISFAEDLSGLISMRAILVGNELIPHNF